MAIYIKYSTESKEVWTAAYEPVFETKDGVKLYRNSNGYYASSDKDAVLKALKEDMNSKNPLDVFHASILFHDLHNKPCYKCRECKVVLRRYKIN